MPVGGARSADGARIATTVDELGVYVLLADAQATGEGFAGARGLDCQPRVISPKGGGFDVKTAISFDLGRAGTGAVKVYDRAGRLVKEVAEAGAFVAGRNVVYWDGTRRRRRGRAVRALHGRGALRRRDAGRIGRGGEPMTRAHSSAGRRSARRFMRRRARRMPAPHRGRRAAGARAQALGGAFTALADDGNALYWNVAGLPRLGHQEFTSTLGNLYGAGFQDNHLGYVFPITDTQAAALSWRQAGQDEAGLGYDENTVSLGYAFRFGKNLGGRRGGPLPDASTDLDGVRFTRVDRQDVRLRRPLRGAASGWRSAHAQGRVRPQGDAQGRPEERIADPALTVGVACRAADARLTVALDVNDRLHLGAEYWYRSDVRRAGRRADGPRRRSRAPRARASSGRWARRRAGRSCSSTMRTSCRRCCRRRTASPPRWRST